MDKDRIKVLSDFVNKIDEHKKKEIQYVVIVHRHIVVFLSLNLTHSLVVKILYKTSSSGGDGEDFF